MFLNNMGTQLFIFIALFVAMFVLSLLRFIRIQAFRKRLNRAYWFVRDLLIATTVDGYSIISLSCLLGFKCLSFQSAGEII